MREHARGMPKRSAGMTDSATRVMAALRLAMPHKTLPYDRGSERA